MERKLKLGMVAGTGESFTTEAEFAPVDTQDYLQSGLEFARSRIARILPLISIVMAAGCSHEQSTTEMENLSSRLIESTVEIDLKGTFTTPAKDKEITGDGSCTGFIYDSQTIITIRHCLGIDPRSTTVTDILGVRQAGSNAPIIKTSLFATPPQKYSYVFPNKYLSSPEVERAFNNIHTHVWDAPVAIVFQKDYFTGHKPLNLNGKPFDPEAQYCIGHFIGYKPNEKWSIQQGKVILPIQQYNYFFNEGGTTSKFSFRSATFNVDGVQGGNSGGPVVNCIDGTVVSVERGSYSDGTKMHDIIIDQDMAGNLIREIENTKNNFKL